MKELDEVLDRPDRLLRQILWLALVVVALVALSDAMSRGNHPALPGSDLLLYGLSGLACLDILWTTTLAFSARTHRLSHEGLLDLSVTTSTSQQRFIMLQALPLTSATTIRVILYSLIAAALRPTLLPPHHIPTALLFVLLGTAALLSVGLLSSSVALLLKRPDPFVWVFVGLSGLCSGALFPTDWLPGPLQSLATLTPVTPMVEGLRGAMLHGQPPSALGGHLLWLITFTALSALAAVVVLKLTLHKGRIDNSTDHC